MDIFFALQTVKFDYFTRRDSSLSNKASMLEQLPGAQKSVARPGEAQCAARQSL